MGYAPFRTLRCAWRRSAMETFPRRHWRFKDKEAASMAAGGREYADYSMALLSASLTAAWKPLSVLEALATASISTPCVSTTDVQ